MTDTQYSITYLKFLNLAKALRALTTYPKLDPFEERLLNFFASAWLLGEQTKVSDCIFAFPEMSPSTAHRRLKTLRKKGYIKLDLDELDSRVKYIVQTDLTKEYFAQLGQCIQIAGTS